MTTNLGVRWREDKIPIRSLRNNKIKINRDKDDLPISLNDNPNIQIQKAQLHSRQKQQARTCQFEVRESNE